nr:hypothetical protein CFP56_24428 [Quercus suber]
MQSTGMSCVLARNSFCVTKTQLGAVPRLVVLKHVPSAKKHFSTASILYSGTFFLSVHDLLQLPFPTVPILPSFAGNLHRYRDGTGLSGKARIKVPD